MIWFDIVCVSCMRTMCGWCRVINFEMCVSGGKETSCVKAANF